MSLAKVWGIAHLQVYDHVKQIFNIERPLQIYKMFNFLLFHHKSAPFTTIINLLKVFGLSHVIFLFKSPALSTCIRDHS